MPLEDEMFSSGDRVQHETLGLGRVEFDKGVTVLVRFESGIEECEKAALVRILTPLQVIEKHSWHAPLAVITRVQAEAIQSANDMWGVFSQSRIELLPHQLWVCRRVLDTWPARWLIADDVGLGKTIEAGLVLLPLLPRGKVKRVLIVCPASLVEQWQTRLRTMFDKYNVMGCLHKLLKDAFNSGHIPQMPRFPGFKGKESVVPPPIEWIEDSDQWRIINHIPIDDRLIFVFMKITGCRTGEARAFRWIDIKGDHIVFEKTIGYNEILKEVKGRKAQPFPMIEALKSLLDSLQRKNLTFVFPNPRTNRPYTKHLTKIWNKACDDAGVKRVRLYNAMRHSFGCQMLNSGIDKAMVQRLLRHTDPKMTDRYAEYSTNALKIALDNVVKMPDLKIIRNKP